MAVQVTAYSVCYTIIASSDFEGRKYLRTRRMILDFFFFLLLVTLCWLMLLKELVSAAALTFSELMDRLVVGGLGRKSWSSE